jgi:hypothetical protein
MIWLFIRELGGEWWELLGTATFTILGFIVARTNRNNEWVSNAILIVGGCLLVVAFYRVWLKKQRALVAAEAKIPTITGEFFDVKLTAQMEPPSNYVFSLYVACGRNPISVKGVKITLFDMNEKPSETIMGNLTHRDDTGGFTSNLDLTPGKGRPATVTFTAQQSFAFTTRMEVFIVDAFGYDHALTQKGTIPFPFQRFK